MKISYFTKLSGVSFRQKEVAKVKPGKTPLRVLAIKDNEYDPFACEVQALLDDGWTQIGWVQKGKNQDLHQFLENGGHVNIECKDITGEDKATLGVNVSVEYGEDDSVDLSSLEKQAVDFGDVPFVYFDAINHKTYDPEGRILQSGSETEHKYAKSVDLTYAAKAIAKKTGLKQEDVTAVWDAKAELSQLYGTAIHKAIELRLTYMNDMNTLDEYKHRDESAVNWMPAPFSDAVVKLEKLLFSVLRLNPANLHTESRLKYGNLTGIADLISLTPETKSSKTPAKFRLFDFKTNSEIKDVKYEFGTKTQYTVQQNHYRTILENLGYECEGMSLLHWDGNNWHVIDLERVDLQKEITWTKQ